MDISKIRSVIKTSLDRVNNIILEGRLPSDETIKAQTEQTLLLKSLQRAILESLTIMSNVKLDNPPKLQQKITKEQIDAAKESAAIKKLEAMEASNAETKIKVAFAIQAAEISGTKIGEIQKLKSQNDTIEKLREEVRKTTLEAQLQSLSPEQQTDFDNKIEQKLKKLNDEEEKQRRLLETTTAANKDLLSAQAAELKTISSAAPSSTGTIDAIQIIDDFNTSNNDNLQQIFENEDLLAELKTLLESQAEGGVIIYNGQVDAFKQLFESSVFKDVSNIQGRRIVAEYLKMLLLQNEQSKSKSPNMAFVEGIVQYSADTKAGDNLLAKCDLLSTMRELLKRGLFNKFKKTNPMVNADLNGLGLNDIEQNVVVLAADSSPAFEKYKELFKGVKDQMKSEAGLQAGILADGAIKNAAAAKKSLAALKPAADPKLSRAIDAVLSNILDVNKVDELLKGHEDAIAAAEAAAKLAQAAQPVKPGTGQPGQQQSDNGTGSTAKQPPASKIPVDDPAAKALATDPGNNHDELARRLKAAIDDPSTTPFINVDGITDKNELNLANNINNSSETEAERRAAAQRTLAILLRNRLKNIVQKKKGSEANKLADSSRIDEMPDEDIAATDLDALAKIENLIGANTGKDNNNEELAKIINSLQNEDQKKRLNNILLSAAKIQAFKTAANLLTGNNSQDNEIEDLSTYNASEFVNSDPDGLVKLLRSERSVNGDASMRVKLFKLILLDSTNGYEANIKNAAKLLQSVINVDFPAVSSSQKVPSSIGEPEIDDESEQNPTEDILYNCIIKILTTHIYEVSEEDYTELENLKKTTLTPDNIKSTWPTSASNKNWYESKQVEASNILTIYGYLSKLKNLSPSDGFLITCIIVIQETLLGWLTNENN